MGTVASAVTNAKVGDVKADMKSLQAQVSKLICATYGNVAESCISMAECRVNMWRYITAKSCTSSVKLCSLPPTNDAFVVNINRCHLQVATWKAALLKSPPTMDPTFMAGNLITKTSSYHEQCQRAHYLHLQIY